MRDIRALFDEQGNLGVSVTSSLTRGEGLVRSDIGFAAVGLPGPWRLARLVIRHLAVERPSNRGVGVP